MEIDKKILKKIANKVDQLGITVVETKSKVNYRTIKKILENGTCTYAVYGRIVTFLENEVIENKDIMSKI